MKRLIAGLIPLFVLVACSGNVIETGANGDGGTNADGGAGNDGAVTTSGCPSSLPNDGVACTPEGLQCEYGTNNGGCGDPTTSCTNGAWKQPPPTPGVACLPNNSCPASHADVTVGATCGADEMECNYPGQGRCTCASEDFGGLPHATDGGPAPNVWACEQPAAGCPVDRPRFGSACSTENQNCFYGSCNMPDSLSISCTGGVWTDQPFACAG
jgi:hypothetical protein